MVSLVLGKSESKIQSWNPVSVHECNDLTWLYQDVIHQLKLSWPSLLKEVWTDIVKLFVHTSTESFFHLLALIYPLL